MRMMLGEDETSGEVFRHSSWTSVEMPARLVARREVEENTRLVNSVKVLKCGDGRARGVLGEMLMNVALDPLAWRGKGSHSATASS
jgi:hypothetical protein